MELKEESVKEILTLEESDFLAEMGVSRAQFDECLKALKKRSGFPKNGLINDIHHGLSIEYRLILALQYQAQKKTRKQISEKFGIPTGSLYTMNKRLLSKIENDQNFSHLFNIKKPTSCSEFQEEKLARILSLGESDFFVEMGVSKAQFNEYLEALKKANLPIRQICMENMFKVISIEHRLILALQCKFQKKTYKQISEEFGISTASVCCIIQDIAPILQRFSTNTKEFLSKFLLGSKEDSNDFCCIKQCERILSLGDNDFFLYLNISRTRFDEYLEALKNVNLPIKHMPAQHKLILALVYYSIGYTQCEIEAKFNVSQKAVSRIMRAVAKALPSIKHITGEMEEELPNLINLTNLENDIQDSSSNPLSEESTSEIDESDATYGCAKESEINESESQDMSTSTIPFPVEEYPTINYGQQSLGFNVISDQSSASEINLVLQRSMM